MLYYNLITRFYCIFCIFLLCAVAQRGGGGDHGTIPPLNKPLDVRVLMVTAYQSQLETIQQVFSKGVVCLILFFL